MLGQGADASTGRAEGLRGRELHEGVVEVSETVNERPWSETTVSVRDAMYGVGKCGRAMMFVH